jgi:hypothetical protein
MGKDEIIRLLKLSLEMHEEAGMNIGFTPAGEKFAADLRAAIEHMEAAPQPAEKE